MASCSTKCSSQPPPLRRGRWRLGGPSSIEVNFLFFPVFEIAIIWLPEDLRQGCFREGFSLPNALCPPNPFVGNGRISLPWMARCDQ